MDLAINGRFLSQQMTGVQRMAREFIWALDRLMGEGEFPHLRARIIAQPDADFGERTLTSIEIERLTGGRGHWWEQVTLPKHLGRSVLLCLGNTAPVPALLGDRPVAVVLHDLAYRLYPHDYTAAYRFGHRLFDSLILRHARPLITVSDAERQMIGRVDPRAAQRIVVAPNGGWTDDASEAEPHLPWRPDGDGAPYGLYVGALSQRKNIDGVIAAAIALARHRGLRFKFVGPASGIATAIAGRLPADVRPLITFRGYVTDDELIALYSGASLLLFPSFHEASGLPPIEAMTFGCPVIVSDTPVMRERCGDAAHYCDPFAHDSIYRAALEVLENPTLAETLSARGRARATQFTWSRQAKQIIAALAKEVGDTGAAPA